MPAWEEGLRMATYLERYLAGECEQVWADLMALGTQVRDEGMYADGLAVARETMRRVRSNVMTLIPRLERAGFVFGYEGFDPDFANRQPATFRPPPADISDTLARIEATIGSLPLSLYAWYETMGEVNFVGRAPESWRPTGFKLEVYQRFVGEGYPDWIYTYYNDHPERLRELPGVDVGPWLDPLQVIPLEDQFALYEDWKLQKASYGDEDYESEEEREALVARFSRFRLDICADHDFKYRKSGSGSYEIAIPDQAADGVLLEEWHRTTFVEYLRICCRWAGFPGLEAFRNPPEDIASLTEGLLRF
jgi:hypothetical protein